MREKTRENTDHFHTTLKWAPHETGGIADGQKSVAFISFKQEFSQFDLGKAETIIISRLMLIKYHILFGLLNQLDGSLPANPVNDRRTANAVTLKSTFCLP